MCQALAGDENMATTQEYIEYVCGQIGSEKNIRYKKMFGEYMIYIDDKPVILVCDNTAFVKKLPELAELMHNADCGFPYDGAKEHYILDTEDSELTEKILEIAKRVIPLPKKKK